MAAPTFDTSKSWNRGMRSRMFGYSSVPSGSSLTLPSTGAAGAWGYFNGDLTAGGDYYTGDNDTVSGTEVVYAGATEFAYGATRSAIDPSPRTQNFEGQTQPVGPHRHGNMLQMANRLTNSADSFAIVPPDATELAFVDGILASGDATTPALPARSAMLQPAAPTTTFNGLRLDSRGFPGTLIDREEPSGVSMGHNRKMGMSADAETIAYVEYLPGDGQMAQRIRILRKSNGWDSTSESIDISGVPDHWQRRNISITMSADGSCICAFSPRAKMWRHTGGSWVEENFGASADRFSGNYFDPKYCEGLNTAMPGLGDYGPGASTIDRQCLFHNTIRDVALNRDGTVAVVGYSPMRDFGGYLSLFGGKFDVWCKEGGNWYLKATHYGRVSSGNLATAISNATGWSTAPNLTDSANASMRSEYGDGIGLRLTINADATSTSARIASVAWGELSTYVFDFDGTTLHQRGTPIVITPAQYDQKWIFSADWGSNWAIGNLNALSADGTTMVSVRWVPGGSGLSAYDIAADGTRTSAGSIHNEVDGISSTLHYKNYCMNVALSEDGTTLLATNNGMDHDDRATYYYGWMAKWTRTGNSWGLDDAAKSSSQSYPLGGAALLSGDGQTYGSKLGARAPYASGASSRILLKGNAQVNDTLAGTPTVPGTYLFSIEATNANGTGRIGPFLVHAVAMPGQMAVTTTLAAAGVPALTGAVATGVGTALDDTTTHDTVEKMLTAVAAAAAPDTASQTPADKLKTFKALIRQVLSKHSIAATVVTEISRASMDAMVPDVVASMPVSVSKIKVMKRRTRGKIAMGGYYPLYLSQEEAAADPDGDGTTHTHTGLGDGRTYYMPNNLGALQYHGNYGQPDTADVADGKVTLTRNEISGTAVLMVHEATGVSESAVELNAGAAGVEWRVRKDATGASPVYKVEVSLDSGATYSTVQNTAGDADRTFAQGDSYTDRQGDWQCTFLFNDTTAVVAPNSALSAGDPFVRALLEGGHDRDPRRSRDAALLGTV